MENLGRKLREAREQQELTLEQIHERTRISMEHLQYLEGNNFDFLPETYVKAFLKDYAKELGLDADEILAIYAQNRAEEQAKLQEQVESDPQQPAEPPVVNSRALEWALAVGAVVLLVALIVMYVQYRTHIYPRPTPELTANMNPYGLMQSRAAKYVPPDEGVEITATDTVWLVVFEPDQVREVELWPEQQLRWPIRDRRQILVGDVGCVRLRVRGKETLREGRRGQKAVVSITADGRVETRQVTYQRGPAPDSTN